MKLIEAMKQIERLSRKQADLRDKLKLYCTHTTIDTPAYGEKTRETDPKVAGAMDQNHAAREAALGAEIDAAGKNLLANMQGSNAPKPGQSAS